MTKVSYLKLLQCVENTVGTTLHPKEVICDFEGALLGAIESFFPDVRIIGCLFHFKQACRRKLKAYQMLKQEAKLAMRPNVFDILTVIDPEKMTQGIAWVKAKIRKLCEVKRISNSSAKWRQFWSYFQRTWVESFPPTYWNVFGMRRDIVSRTNNPFERFHRLLNGKMRPHPPLDRFVNALESLSRDYVAQRRAVVAGLQQPPERGRFQLPRAPRLPSIDEIEDSASSSDDDAQNTIDDEDSDSVSSRSSENDEEIDRALDEVDNSFEYDGD